MPARATSSATISFGLVTIPVKVYAAVQSKAVHFNMLDPRDHSRVKQQLVNANTGEAVERGSTLRGYEYARGQYVVFTDAELEALEQKSDKSIEIEEFVPIERVDPILFEKSNLLGPDKGAAKAYRLLNEAMILTGRVAVGRFASRGRHQLSLIRPLQRGLVLHGLYYADEVRSFDDIEFGDEVELRKGEVDLATQLIEQLSTERFDATRYEDEYRRDVLAAVDKKVGGQEIVALPRHEPREQIIDLVEALKRSLAERGDTPAAAGRVRKPARAKGRKAGRRASAR
jgi:DNA end-binding protein Ku